ncbi:MAG: bactofilin family protein, partial [Planctomycetota bacterium]
GTIKAKGQVEVANKAVCQADIEAGVVAIDGGMQGNVTASDKLQLNATADLKGDVVAAKLVVSDGARLDGHFKVGPDLVKKGAAPAAPPRPGGPGQDIPREGKDVPGGPGQDIPREGKDVPGGPKK